MDVRFTVFSKEQSVVVPKTAVFTMDDHDWVWLIREDTLLRQQIVKGVETKEGYIIAAGIAAGDFVVTDADNENLADGKSVKIV